MARRDNALAVASPLVKSIIFAVVGFLILAVLWIQFGQIRFRDQSTYSAIFSSSSSMRPSSPVTASGVTVGRVDEIEVVDNSKAKVTFTVDTTVPLTESTEARIRYKNLTGDQYLDLTAGENPDAPPLPSGGTIPIERTEPALDIDVLLSGFDPLFQGLQPDQVNELSTHLVTVLQGQGGTINSLLGHTASFTGALAEQDQVIGSVITNLNTVLASLSENAGDLDATVRGVEELVTKLNRDRQPLLDGLERTETLARQIGDIASALRTGHDTFLELGEAAELFVDNGQEVDRILGLMPGAYLRLGRLSVSGGHYQLNICTARLRMTGPDGNPYYSPQVGPSDNSPRCSRDNITPLQGGDPSVGVHGPPLPAAPYDGQGVASGARDQQEGDGFVPPQKRNNGNGR